MAIKNNHPAFPVQAYVGDKNNPPVRSNTGMSMRDWFAGKTLQGMIANPEDTFHTCDVDEIAEWCFKMSDAMLKQRDK